MTVSSHPAGEHASTNPSAPIRHTVDTLNSDALDELYDEIDRLRAKVAEFDHIINWHTTCASCARILDSSYQETMRAETAEAVIAQVQEVHAFAKRVVATSGPGPASAVQAVLDRLRDATGQQDGEHVYLSTGCRHGDHDYCKNPTGRAGAKRPAECKHCGARCICPCHKTSEGQPDV